MSSGNRAVTAAKSHLPDVPECTKVIGALYDTEINDNSVFISSISYWNQGHSSQCETKDMSIPALNAGIHGINQGLGNLRRDASAVAQAVGNNQNSDVASALVNVKLDTLQVQASTKVVETVDDILGSLLDVTA
jgi:hypothetical protein